jgi:hypothetical protein
VPLLTLLRTVPGVQGGELGAHVFPDLAYLLGGGVVVGQAAQLGGQGLNLRGGMLSARHAYQDTFPAGPVNCRIDGGRGQLPAGRPVA